MNRIVNNEKLMPGEAYASTVVASLDEQEASLAAFARLGRVFGNSVRQFFARIALANELGKLDDRILADLGIARCQIADVARSVTPGTEIALGAELSRFLKNGIVRPLVAWQRRRKAFAALMALDDRMLADIGLARHEIANHVRKLGYGSAPAHATAKVELAASFQANRAQRKTIKELSRLSDRELQDIGVARSEIAEIAETLIERHYRAANVNGSDQEPKAA